ncbi:MAG: DUF3617 domain-containing protein [Methylophilaceae bacterium]
MLKTFTVILLTFSTFSSTAKETNTNMRAGLWKITTTSDLLLLAQHIPPDQLKGLEQLAKEYGLEMPQLDNGAAISQTCITQEMAEQQMLPDFYQEELGCTSKSATRNGNYYKTDFTCNSDQLKGDGTAKGTVTSPTSFSGTTQFVGLAQGARVNEQADIDGKWISTSCGNVKPL